MSPPPLNVLERRARATQATFDRFNGAALDWVANDCVRLTDFHLKALGTPTPIGKFGSWANEGGALRSMKRQGFQTLEGILDSFLLPIPPAMALIGDIVGLQSDTGAWVALTVAIGNGRVLGFLEGAPPVCGALQINWSAIPADRPALAWRSC